MSEPSGLCGFLNVLKPPGMTSAHVVAVVRRLLAGAKIGHAGTLDPEAAGVLPLMIGKAARLFDYMQDKEKTYVTEVAFGCATDTQDAQGKVIEEGEAYPSKEALLRVLSTMQGKQMQTPPMFSALKQDGKRLYELARSGKEADIPAREVTVHELSLIDMTENHGALLKVRCSKGFYVRTLCKDIGEKLACPSHMRFLLRAQSGAFTLQTVQTLEEIEAAAKAGTLASMLILPEEALPHMEVMNLPPNLDKPVRNGGKLLWNHFAPFIKNANAPFGIRIDGVMCAVAQRCEDRVTVRTWLGE